MAEPTPVEPWDGRDAGRLMTLDPAGPDRFTNPLSGVRPDRHLYGGQVLAHSLVAAARTAPDRRVHSLHGYFLRPGNGHHRVTFEVERTRDGRTFATRRVVARQGDHAIFHLECSFRAPEPGGLEHQVTMPAVPAPEALPTLQEHAQQSGDPRALAACERLRPLSLIEVKLINPASLAGTEPHPCRRLWVRIPSAASTYDPAIQAALLAYLSDYWLAGAPLTVHSVSYEPNDPRTASLDHAVWFHRPGRVDDWLLFDMDSPSLTDATGLARGLLYRRDGVLLASCAQEALLRVTPPAG